MVGRLMSTPLAWITGGGGLIGNALAQTAPACAADWQVLRLTRAQLELTDFNAVRQAFHQQRPQLIIHCAALSKSPACQSAPSLARKLNVEMTACLAELTADIRF